MPGDAGFMTAGKGITHTERTPLDMRNEKRYPAHGYQIWIALPEELEEMEPTFDYLPKSEMPEWYESNLQLRLVAGEALGRKSKLKVWSPLFMIDIIAKDESFLTTKGQLRGEAGIVVVSGGVIADGENLKPGQMLVTDSDTLQNIKFKKDTRVLLLGGQPFEKPRYLLWNFVSSRKDRLEQAKQDWIAKKFPKVPGDDTYVPFP
jgi:redox-sensitive bicupin YhaK (pirin superfamily)